MNIKRGCGDIVRDKSPLKTFLQRVCPYGTLLSDSFFVVVVTLFCFTILYWFCDTLTWICHGCTWVPNPEPPSHLPPHIISLDHPHAPAPSILYPVLNIDWRFELIVLISKKKDILGQKNFLPLLSHPLASENILLDNNGYSKLISCHMVYIPCCFCRF